ncbi:hypothetical protein Pint_26116 [Pistacia integerrima]|uniref:Uncharacterized protein n=1 Tax=Pistacia integerrima TaxID=434235 RepID=A0ACC0YFN7_9ROSI|nr:hypothetical protein Pint_26116 [Pistacia integerrima]
MISFSFSVCALLIASKSQNEVSFLQGKLQDLYILIEDNPRNQNLCRFYFMISVVCMASALLILGGGLVSLGWQSLEGGETLKKWKIFTDLL